MKVFALGGYGKTGLPAVKLLTQSDSVTEIAVVGRNLERAEKAAREIGEKAIPLEADGTDEDALTSLLGGYDILMNIAFSDTVLPAIRGAIHTGIPYCDAATFGDFLDQALVLDAEAKNAGVTAIVAIGISPCISNLIGVHAASKLEEVEQLQIGRADIFNFETGRELTPRQWLEDPVQSLAELDDFKPFIGWLLQRLGENGSRNVLVFQDGQWVEVDPINDGLVVPLPGGGRSKSFPYFSGDDFWGMLPRDLSSVAPVEMQFSPFPPQTHNLLREYAIRVLGGGIDADTAVSSFYDTMASNPQRWLVAPDNFVAPFKLWVSALGRKKGFASRSSCWFTPPMWDVGGYYLTSVSLAVAVRKILRGEVPERGVLSAEKAFEPLPFLDEVADVISDSLPEGKMIDESFEWLH
jgi:hypothetical protein